MTVINVRNFILKLCILFSLLAVQVKEVQASFGDSCTSVNTSNCTRPQLSCSRDRTCTCSQGYVKDNSHGINITCRKPSFNEKCDTTIGCQISQHCTNVSGSTICRCDSLLEYYDPRTDRCASKPTTGERCDVIIGCVEYNKCVNTHPTPPTCQCNSSDVYLDDINSMCLPISYLQVSVISTAVTATTVTFMWDGSSPESGVDYSIEWVPHYGRGGLLYAEGGQVIELQPGTQYNFTIVSSLSGSLYNPGKKYFGPNVTICTKVLYGGECDVCRECQDESMYCIQAVDTKLRCLCNDTFFNASKDGNCTSLDELIVTNISSTSTTSVIHFTWNEPTRMGSITYQIEGFPYFGNVDNITSTGGDVSGLGPGIQYYFTIISVVPADAFNKEKRARTTEYITTTKRSHLQMCASYAPEVCQQPLVCIPARDGKSRCMCASTYYYNYTKEICSSLEDLKVSGVSVTVTARTATLTWSAQTQPTSLTYALTWTPSGGRLDSVTSTTAHLSGLASGTVYSFTIVTVLPLDVYYPERRAYTQVSSIITKPAFNETCNLSIGCQNYQHCANISGSMVCQCDSASEYYDTVSDQCLSRPTLDEPCDVSIGCAEYYQCVGQPPTCQCNTSYVYFDVASYQCLPLSDLQVSHLSMSVSATTVTFNWDVGNPDSGADYDIKWTPSGGQLNYTDFDGGLVTGLEPGSRYNFTIMSVLAGEEVVSEKRYLGPNVTVCTHILYGGECSICNICQDNTTTCIKARDGKTRCLCGSTLFNKTQTGNCSPLAELAVDDITDKTSTSSVNLTWTVATQVSFVTYRIKWTPGQGQVDRISSTGGAVSGLTPGTLYYFSITSVIAPDLFNDEKNVTSPDYLTKTHLLYLGGCVPYTNEECQYMTPCAQANDHTYRCMCGTGSYFNEKLLTCSSLDDYKVSNVSVTATSTTLAITWTLPQDHTSDNYALDWTPSEGTLDSINSSSAHLFGLTPGRQYNLSIDSILLPSINYPEKTVSVLVTVKTKTQPDSSSNNSGVGVGVAVGVACAVLVIILVFGIDFYKRRTAQEPTRTRLRESFDHETVAGEVVNVGQQEEVF